MSSSSIRKSELLKSDPNRSSVRTVAASLHALLLLPPLSAAAFLLLLLTPTPSRGAMRLARFRSICSQTFLFLYSSYSKGLATALTRL